MLSEAAYSFSFRKLLHIDHQSSPQALSPPDWREGNSLPRWNMTGTDGDC